MARCLRDVIVHTCPDNPDHTWLSPFTCNDRFCPRCSGSRYRPRIRALRDAGNLHLLAHPEYRARHIILTWRPHQLTRSNVRALWSASRKFLAAIDHAWSVRSLEISRGSFLHVHVIAATRPISKTHLERTWRAIAGHSWIVRVRTARAPSSLKKLLNYLLHYTTKALPELDVPEIRQAITGTRRIATTGALYNTPHQHDPKRGGCPCCGMKTRSHIMRVPACIDAPDVDALLYAFSDRAATLQTLTALHCRDPSVFTEKGRAALSFHTEAGPDNTLRTRKKGGPTMRVKRKLHRLAAAIAAATLPLHYAHHRPVGGPEVQHEEPDPKPPRKRGRPRKHPRRPAPGESDFVHPIHQHEDHNSRLTALAPAF